MVDNAAGLAWIVNLGCIELHPHPVRSADLEHPDELRVDLDPGPGVAWSDVRTVALEVRACSTEDGPARLAQDQRIARHAHQCPHPTALDFHGSPPRRPCPIARHRTARARLWPLPNGGRRSDTASFSTTTRTPKIAPPARPTLCARCPTPASPRRSTGTRSPIANPPISRSSPSPTRFAETWRPTPKHRPVSRLSREHSWNSPRATKPQDSVTLPGRRTSARWKAKRRASRRRAPNRAAQTQARKNASARGRQFPDKDAALAGLERWKAEAPEGCRTPSLRRRAGRLHARPLLHLDPHSHQSPPRARRTTASAGNAGSR